MRALVTGAAGFIGPHLLRRLFIEGHEACGFLLPPEQLPSDLARVPVLRGDIREPATLERAFAEAKPEVIFHLAGFSRPGDCRANPEAAWDVNFVGTLNVYRAAASIVPGARVFHAGSCTQYGAPASGELPLTETSPLRPGDVYAATKTAGDLVGAELSRTGSLDVIRVRSFNTIGPGQMPGFVASDFAAQVARMRKGHDEPRLAVGNLSAERDFVDVRDAVRAYVLLMQKGEPGEAYNICTGQAHSVRGLLDGLLEAAGVKAEVVVDESRLRPGDASRVVGSHAKLTQATGWTPEVPWPQTLADLLDDWCRRV